ncbi:amidohydrolase family protein [Pedobacter sp. LMG 31464]|uniref:Amidohydrolase family protein n=1 Tax=Pedobacter planticolens TaxID=2679964 RepID=A0A923IVC6_9SPHI|nr:amidohydrolase family protein [Pedobacter planticolens]MBB2145876.1 amidohydrolase family protein [Pedobacter planticolens]
MLKYLSANWIFPVSSKPIKNGVIGVSEDGSINAVLTKEEAQGIENIQYYDGFLVPGFINTHCHLELSHLHQKIAEKTGLTTFIKQILGLRQQPEEEIILAMQSADQEMYENGIVAVGDISNLLISKSVKLESKIYYHTFVEVFGFNRPSEPIIEQGLQLKKDFAPLKASVVPHAPYSVSSSLFDDIEKVTSFDDILSIHNQETAGENELFETGTGKFADFFAEVGIAQSDAHNSNKNSLKYHLPQLSKKVNTLLVHNTFSSKADVDFAKKEHQKLYWCLCPNANLYIENTLPDVDLLKEENLKITLGTDSLASNHQLNILAEMQTLQEHKNVSFEELLKWATLNGAEFLGIESQFGSLGIGKKPGVVLISNAENGVINKETTIKRLF